MSTDYYTYLPYSEYIARLFEDLNRAEQLLEESDIIQEFSNQQLNWGNTINEQYNTSFWYYRQKRFNLYGVKGLLARLYLWTGQKEKACEKAREVLAAKQPDGTPRFRLGNASDIEVSSYETPDYALYVEQLSGLKMEEWTDRLRYFQYTFVNKRSVIEGQLFASASTDIRLKILGNYNSSNFGEVKGTLKYSRFSSTDYVSAKSVPLIRLAEMYLILMEAVPIEEANQRYEEFCDSRSIPFVPLSEQTRQEVILKEYVREFFSEGQSFFAHKRMNRPTMLLSGKEISNNGYVLPIPTAEFGYTK